MRDEIEKKNIATARFTSSSFRLVLIEEGVGSLSLRPKDSKKRERKPKTRPKKKKKDLLLFVGGPERSGDALGFRSSRRGRRGQGLGRAGQLGEGEVGHLDVDGWEKESVCVGRGGREEAGAGFFWGGGCCGRAGERRRKKKIERESEKEREKLLLRQTVLSRREQKPNWLSHFSSSSPALSISNSH